MRRKRNRAMLTAVDRELRCVGNLISPARMVRIDGYSFSGLEHRDIRLGEKGADIRLGENGRLVWPW